MSLKPWSTFYPDVRSTVLGCPDVLIDHCLRKAAIEMCSKSKRLKLEMDAFTTVAGTSDYDLSPDSNTETITILDATADGEPIDPATRDILSAQTNWKTDQGAPTNYLLVTNDETIRLWKTPDAAYSIELTLALKPSQSATGVEGWFADRYMSGISAGALASLLLMPKRAWTNNDLSMHYRQIFEEVIRSACADADKDGTRAPLRTTTYGRA